jgi:hypothetical protein
MVCLIWTQTLAKRRLLCLLELSVELVLLALLVRHQQAA